MIKLLVGNFKTRPQTVASSAAQPVSSCCDVPACLCIVKAHLRLVRSLFEVEFWFCRLLLCSLSGARLSGSAHAFWFFGGCDLFPAFFRHLGDLEAEFLFKVVGQLMQDILVGN